MADRTFVVPRPPPVASLDRFLANEAPGLSIERARSLLAEGRVRIRGKACKPARRLWGGEEVVVSFPEPIAAKPEKLGGFALPILFEDAGIVVVDKPAGLVVEPFGALPSVVGILAKRSSGFDAGGVAQPGVVHRLDRETSGCLALAKTDADVAALNRAFDEKRVEKHYRAIVLGEPPDAARLEAPYSRDPKDPRKFTTKVASARRAALSFRVLARAGGAALLDVTLETGRTHQIRVQLSEAGFPVLADHVYGSRETREHPVAQALGRHALHAFSLALPHPRTGERLACTAPLPAEFVQALASLGLSAE